MSGTGVFFMAIMRTGGMIALAWGLLWTAPAGAEPAVIAPLAVRSLLLDGVSLDGGRLVVVGERGHILYSDDHGDQWRQASVPTQATLTAVFFYTDKMGWAVGHDAVILFTRDGGKTWEKVFDAPEEERPLLDMWSPDGRNGVAIGAYGYFLETGDWGKTWQARAICDDDWHLNQIMPAGNNRLFIAAEAGIIYRSDDAGRNWKELPSPYEGSFFGVLPLTGDTLIVFGLRGHLFRSEDAGETWTPIETGTEAMLNTGVHLPDGRVAVAGLAGTLLISRDEGRRFTLIQQPDRKGIAALIPVGDKQLVLVGDGGVRKISLKEPL